MCLTPETDSLTKCMVLHPLGIKTKSIVQASDHDPSRLHSILHRTMKADKLENKPQFNTADYSLMKYRVEMVTQHSLVRKLDSN